MGVLRKHPWPHLVVDGFLPRGVFEDGYAEVMSEPYAYDMEPRGTGRIEYSLLKSHALWRAIYSKQTVLLLSAAFGVEVVLNKDNVLQLRRMNEQTPAFPLHNDFTSDGDKIASFLYISPNWKPACGGYLHLHESDDQPAPSLSLEPLANRFIAFRTSASHWHSVERVRGWERLSVLSLWDIVGTVD